MRCFEIMTHFLSAQIVRIRKTQTDISAISTQPDAGEKTQKVLKSYNFRTFYGMSSDNELK